MRFTRTFILSLVVMAAFVPPPARAQGPKGWVGVVITTGIGTMNETGAMVFTDYPTVESIDPGSPAEKAGLQAGDVLISINSQDFKKNPIPLTSLLVPGQKVAFRYKRHEVLRAVTMTVVEASAKSKQYVELHIIQPVPRAEKTQRERTEGMLRVGAGEAPRRAIVNIAPLVIGSGAPTLNLFGADMTELNADFREALKLKSDGVLVINVALGTPAGVAGLRSGDVIIEAANETVQNPGELIRLMRNAGDNSLLLRVLRKQKSQTITLRW